MPTLSNLKREFTKDMRRRIKPSTRAIPSDAMKGLLQLTEDLGTSLETSLTAAVYRHTLGSASRLPEYMSWMNMRQRCLNPNTPTWDHYGGRGIEVHSSWECFWTFLAGVGRSPGAGYSLDRIDVDGNYAPGNVRWATKKEQSRNRRDNNLIEAFGVTRCAEEWSQETGIAVTTIRGRIAAGWDTKQQSCP